MYMDAASDDGHCLALYEVGGLWGAVAKSNFTTIRSREAIYPYTGPSGHECMPTLKSAAPAGPFGRNLPLARAIRDAVRAAGCTTPVVGSGAINSFDLAERALQSGDCDLVAAARQSLADPDWWRKMEEGRGSDVRRCIFTNYCEGLDQKHHQVTCQLWDRDFERADEGGGIARSHDGKRRLPGTARGRIGSTLISRFCTKPPPSSTSIGSSS